MTATPSCTAHQEHHVGQTARASRLRGVRPHRRQMGAPAHLPDVRRDALLRLVTEPPRVQHARAAASHPVIASAERGERWLYCFPDDAFVES